MSAENHKEEKDNKEERSKEEITLKEETIIILQDIKSLLKEIRDLYIESKEIEKESIKKKKEKAEAREKRKFVPPTLEDVEGFCFRNNLSSVDPKTFFAYYENNGWRISSTGKKMVSWKATCVSWDNRNKEKERENARVSKNVFDELANIHEDDPMDWGTI